MSYVICLLFAKSSQMDQFSKRWEPISDKEMMKCLCSFSNENPIEVEWSGWWMYGVFTILANSFSKQTQKRNFVHCVPKTENIMRTKKHCLPFPLIYQLKLCFWHCLCHHICVVFCCCCCYCHSDSRCGILHTQYTREILNKIDNNTINTEILTNNPD